MVDWLLVFFSSAFIYFYHYSEEIRETREIKHVEKSTGKPFLFHVTIAILVSKLFASARRSFIISDCIVITISFDSSCFFFFFLINKI